MTNFHDMYKGYFHFLIIHMERRWKNESGFNWRVCFWLCKLLLKRKWHNFFCIVISKLIVLILTYNSAEIRKKVPHALRMTSIPLNVGLEWFFSVMWNFKLERITSDCAWITSAKYPFYLERQFVTFVNKNEGYFF